MSSVLENGTDLSLDEKRALLAQLLREKSKKASSAPLSFAQQRLWFLDRLEPGNPFYNIPQAIRLSGVLNTKALEQTLQVIVSRHESLRTIFSYVDGSPVQIISDGVTVALPVNDLSQLPAAEREPEARRLASEEARRQFDLARGPLLRASLLRLAEEDHVLLLTMHHIVSDAWSSGILFREFGALYEAFTAGKPSPLPELTIQYADYAVWQREWLQGEVLEKQLAYWGKQLGGELPVLELPTDRPRPVVQTFNGAHRAQKLSKELSEQLKAFSQREGVTLYMLLLAAFQILLSRYGGQEEIIVGSPIAGRNRAEIEGLIGFFVNTLVMRTDLSGNPTVRELLRRVKEVALGAYAHQDLPFEKLVEELQPERSLSHSPLFQVLFAVQNAPGRPLELEGLRLNPFGFENKTAKFDLEMHIWEGAENLTCSFFYNTDLFDADTASRMMRNYEQLLEGIVDNPEERISDLPLLTEAERDQLLEWNNTEREYPRDKCLHQLFEEQVKQRPDAPAIVFKDQQLTYRQLNERANQLAHYLRKRGVRADKLVAICVERSVEMVIALLGTLKAGGAYVPMDPEYPAERLSFMLTDTAAPVLLTQERLLERLPESDADVVCLDKGWKEISKESTANTESEVKPDNLAYVIYTSGSTGRPKGVMMSQGSLLNLVCWQLESTAITGQARTLQFASLSFDVSFQEIFFTWCSGGTLVLVAEEVRRDAESLCTFIEENGVERLFLPFVALQHLAEAVDNGQAVLSTVREVITAGEQLQITPQIASMFGKLKGCTLENQYGPTESHVVTAFRLKGRPDEWETLPPIGRPIANGEIYILDAHLKPVAIGVAGELYIGGDGLARGYLNRPDLTDEKFVPNPFSREEGTRLYRAGDRARYRADGNIEFLGRIDHQVKVRGYRIEPGEIESLLAEHAAVREAVVMVREESGDKRLVAYVVAGQGQVPIASELRSYLKAKLPEYMVPTAFVLLEELPLTPSGKVDRRALPAPDQSRMELEEGFIGPRDELELQLTRLWEEILCVKPIGVTDNFFELGGHSLLAVRLFAQIEKRFSKNLPLATLFQAPTIEHLASILRQEGWVSSWSSLVPIKTTGSKPALYLVHPGGGNVLCYRALARLLGPDQPVYALQAQGLDGKRPAHTSLEEMAAHYLKEMRALQPEGPYYLGGASSGGVLAFEMAQQLHAQGLEVGMLVMIDTFFPGSPRYLPNRTLFRSKLHRMVMRADVHLGHLLIRRPKEQLKYIMDGVGRIKKSLKKKTVNRFSAEDPLRRTIQSVRNVNERAFMIYKPKPYSGRITYFWCVEMMFRPYMDNRLGWDLVAENGLDVHMVPGSHTELLDIEPHTRVLADELNRCLLKIQTDSLHEPTAESKKEGAYIQTDQLDIPQKVSGMTVR